jgi:hypothetical protein
LEVLGGANVDVVFGVFGRLGQSLAVNGDALGPMETVELVAERAIGATNEVPAILLEQDATSEAGPVDVDKLV